MKKLSAFLLIFSTILTSITSAYSWPWSRSRRLPKTATILKKNSLAFNLVEMLVVMAIILSLATIVLGVIMKGLKRAEEVEEVSDTRQDNIIMLIDTVQSGEGYDALPEHIKKGEFGGKGSE